MDGSRQTERSGVALQRIVALLFALADMAERAADAPHRVRSVVLMILRTAEPAAQGIVFGTGYGQPAPAATKATVRPTPCGSPRGSGRWPPCCSA